MSVASGVIKLGKLGGNIIELYKWWIFQARLISRGISEGNMENDMDVGQNGRPMWDHRCECLV